MKEEFITDGSQEKGWGGGRRPLRATWGSRRITKKAWPRALIVFPAGKARQERLASLTNVSGLWAVGMVSGFLVLGPGLI